MARSKATASAMSIGLCSMSTTRKSKPQCPIASATVGEPDMSHEPRGGCFGGCWSQFLKRLALIANLSIDGGLRHSRLSLQKIKIAALRRLAHVRLVEGGIGALVWGHRS